MTSGWLLLSLLGPPVAAAVATVAFRTRRANPVASIALNAVAPGAGLAATHRPTLEVVLAVLFAQASLLVTGGPDKAAMLLPIAAISGLWASLHTPLSPIALAAADRRRDAPAVELPGPTDPSVASVSEAARESRDPADGAADEVGYSIAVHCTECGAAVDVPVLSHMARCTFCGSHHLVVGHDETLYVTLPERITDEARIQDELDVYNALLPRPGELSATLFIEITDKEQIQPVLEYHILDRNN